MAASSCHRRHLQGVKERGVQSRRIGIAGSLRVSLRLGSPSPTLSVGCIYAISNSDMKTVGAGHALLPGPEGGQGDGRKSFLAPCQGIRLPPHRRTPRYAEHVTSLVGEGGLVSDDEHVTAVAAYAFLDVAIPRLREDPVTHARILQYLKLVTGVEYPHQLSRNPRQGAAFTLVFAKSSSQYRGSGSMIAWVNRRNPSFSMPHRETSRGSPVAPISAQTSSVRKTLPQDIACPFRGFCYLADCPSRGCYLRVSIASICCLRLLCDDWLLC